MSAKFFAALEELKRENAALRESVTVLQKAVAQLQTQRIEANQRELEQMVAGDAPPIPVIPPRRMKNGYKRQ